MELDKIRVLGQLMTTEEFRSSYPDAYDHYDSIYNDDIWNPSFHIKPVSQLPEEINDVKSFICLAERLDDTLVRMHKEDIRKELEDKFIIFRPVLGDNGSYFAYDPEFLDSSNTGIIHYDKYTAIPYLDLDSLKLNLDTFEEKLKSGTPINIYPMLSYDDYDKTDCIMVKVKKLFGTGVYVYLYSGVDMKAGFGNIVFKKDNPAENRKILNIKKDADKIITSKKNGVAFIPFEIEEKYLITVKGIPTSPITQESNIIAVPSQINDVPSDFENMQDDFTNETAVVDDENDFIIKLKNVATHAGLVYDNLDLLNFHISVLSSNLVILAGMSGTGKSKLAKIYANALGINQYNGIKFVAVSPAWTDDSDILGYVDYKNMLYREADTGLVSLLKAAEENPDRKYLICFDEMNLARVEHYFSQFISILEDEPEERKLVLYNDNLEGKLYNSMLYPPSIKIGQNVIFVGTVNVDESTFNFTDKVLDRANVIKLKMQPFSMLKNIVKDFNLTSDEIEFFTELHNVLHSENPKLGLGYRIITQINQYLNLVKGEGGYTRNNAIDRLVVQRIVTKLRGSENQLASLVGTINSEGKVENSKIIEVLDKYNKVSEFKEVRNELTNKAKELSSYGYTI